MEAKKRFTGMLPRLEGISCKERLDHLGIVFARTPEVEGRRDKTCFTFFPSFDENPGS